MILQEEKNGSIAVLDTEGKRIYNILTRFIYYMVKYL